MAGNVTDIRSKATDSEKITINLGYVDLGHIDLLVQEGFYSNRTDFITDRDPQSDRAAFRCGPAGRDAEKRRSRPPPLHPRRS